jgi:single-stranded-DNA-specific exonuclease
MAKLGRLWRLAPVETKLRNSLSRSLGISEIVAQVLINRGIADDKSARDFLYSGIERLVDPYQMKDMDKAVARITQAITEEQKITVYGDYDVDGITASALMYRVFSTLGATVEYYIPERQSEGYGLNTAALENLILTGTNLIITVDCGISAVQEVTAIQSRVDIIITDHHQPPEIVPPAYAILNPKQLNCSYQDKQLAGVGVAFKLCQALWAHYHPDAPMLEQYLDIVAVGTIADIVPLLGENRALVRMGLKQLSVTDNIGLRALQEVCGVTGKRIDTGKVGFVLAPRLNAAGRISHAAAGVELLITDDAARANELAVMLNQENLTRQTVEKEILMAADNIVAALDIGYEKVLVVSGDNWHPGVIGIVASRLVEKYYRPVVMIALKDGIGKGSCRSIPGFDMYDALKSAADILIQFGGHRQAAGLSIEAGNINELKRRLTSYATEQLQAEDYIPKIQIDSLVALEEINTAFLEQMSCLEPHGMGNPSPVFASSQLQLTDIRPIGQEQRHLKCKVFHKCTTAEVIGWDMGVLHDTLHRNDYIDLAFIPEFNEWQGVRSIQLRAHDLKAAEKIVSPIEKLFAQGASDNRYKNILQAERFSTKVAGVTFSGRQEFIKELQQGDKLILIREPQNSHDNNAIRIDRQDGSTIGYINAKLAAELALALDRACQYQCAVSAVTGGGDQPYGVNIFIWRENPLSAGRDLSSTIDRGKTVQEALLGNREYHHSQLQVLSRLTERRNTLAIMGTGRGKSAIFQSHAALLALQGNKMTIILYPLRALVNDQYLNLTRKLEGLGLHIYKGNGTLTADERTELFAALGNRAVDILLTTPEFLEANLAAFTKLQEHIEFLVIDESHHISLSGKRQRPVYQRLGHLAKLLGNPVVLAATATADDKICESICSTLTIQEVVVDKTIRTNLLLEDQRCTADKLSYLCPFLNSGEKSLIYVNSRKQAVDIACKLRTLLPDLGEQIGFYHAGLSNEWRVQVENWFRSGQLKTIVTTSAFGEGIDFPDIRHVVLYHLPFNQTAFNQQCGRAGRDGERSHVHLVFGHDDIRLNTLILKETSPDRTTVGKVYLVIKESLLKDVCCSDLTNLQIANKVNTRFGPCVNETAVATSIKILEELQLLWRETKGPKRTIHLNQAPNYKLDIEQSLTYREGVLEKEAFQLFAEDVMQLSAADLLSWINRPVIPEKYKECDPNGL